MIYTCVTQTDPCGFVMDHLSFPYKVRGESSSLPYDDYLDLRAATMPFDGSSEVIPVRTRHGGFCVASIHYSVSTQRQG